MIRLLPVILLFLAVVGPLQAEGRPNILLIVSDDMGYSDLGCYGGEIQTPNLDRLAEKGLRFTRFYNTSRCWSSRASILTGYYPHAIRRDMLLGEDRGEYGMFGKASGANGVRPRWAQVLPAYLKQVRQMAFGWRPLADWIRPLLFARRSQSVFLTGEPLRR